MSPRPPRSTRTYTLFPYTTRFRSRSVGRVDMPVGDILPEITLILTAAAILLVAAFVRQDWHWLAAPLALIGLAVAGVLLVAQLGRSELTFSGVWADRKSTRLNSSH